MNKQRLIKEDIAFHLDVSRIRFKPTTLLERLLK